MPAARPTIAAIVFDLDGLLFNTEDVFELTGQELARRHGRVMTDDVRREMMGRRAVEAYALLKERFEIQKSVEEISQEAHDIFFSLVDDILAPMPGLFEILDHIDSVGLPKGVATSSGRPYLEDILGRYDLLPRFDMTLTAEDVSAGKPDPEIYLKAAARLNIDPSTMLVCEDSGQGTAAGAAAGAVVVSIPHRHSTQHDFSGATYVAQSLHDPRVLAMIAGT